MTRTLTTVLGNSQRLDGGAMFGNAPRALWERWSTPDERNRIPLACRALLVRDGNRNILLETGIGAFFEPRLRDRFGVVEEQHVLLQNLEDAGAPHTSIDVVVLSHLHFDHAGGLLTPWRDGENPELLFPNATYVVGEEAWERATHPHPRDRASFLPELNALLSASGRLEKVASPRPGATATSAALGDGWRFHISHGHTPGLLLAEIDMPAGPVVFAADLVPGTPWLHAAITMGYDRFPEQLINEKQALLDDLVRRRGRLVYTHDPGVAMSGVGLDERGRFVPTEPLERVEGLTR
ncbi:MAG: glyoxylase-like metal-dependent hydrolase (beta-lactamase superfamily II) [Myxococcota bacterium]|jgi:glyoxylase-like metal-dependent hydrolase (beta-lactamase superfamily II)